MILIKNKILPFGSFNAINLFGVFLFYKGEISKKTINHEKIHSAQWKETFYIGFICIYLFEFIKNLIYELNNTRNRTFKEKWHLAYRLVSFECEAYTWEFYEDYLKNRKKYAWLQFYE